MNPRCQFELRPFQPCGRIATRKEYWLGKTWCAKHAAMKEKKFDLKTIPINQGKSSKTPSN